MVDLLWLFSPQPRIHTIRWEWPMAIYQGPMKRHASYLACETPYSDILAKSENHGPIGVVILKYNQLNGGLHDKPHRILFDDRFRSLRTAIEFAEHIIANKSDWHPKIF